MFRCMLQRFIKSESVDNAFLRILQQPAGPDSPPPETLHPFVNSGGESPFHCRFPVLIVVELLQIPGISKP